MSESPQMKLQSECTPFAARDSATQPKSATAPHKPKWQHHHTTKVPKALSSLAPPRCVPFRADLICGAGDLLQLQEQQIPAPQNRFINLTLNSQRREG